MKASEINETPFAGLFAYGDDAAHLIGSPQSGFTFAQGIPAMYSSRSGKKVDRKDINGLGRMISQSRVFNQCGGYYTYDPEVSAAIGGYPLGAILYYADPGTAEVRLVRSLVENNTNNFVENSDFINGQDWSYVDNVLPVSCRPRIFPDYKHNNTGTITTALSSQYTATCDMLFLLQTGTDQGSTSASMQSGASSGSNAGYASNVDEVDDSDYDSEDVPSGGGNDGYITASGESKSASIVMFARVRRVGEEEFNTAAVVGYVPSIDSSYDIYAYMLDAKLMASAGFTGYYAPSPIQLYLKAGDTVKITCSMNDVETLSFRYIAIPLLT